jgi:NADH-quinone oxidoreductase subunit C
MTDEKKEGPKTAVEQPAVEQSPENVPTPDPAGTEVTPVGRRTGMFGVQGSGDTTGYGGLVKPTLFPAPAQAPYGGWFDVVAQGLDGLIESVVIHRKEITFHIARENLE